MTMKTYIILANPGHNRIYFDAALQMAANELRAVAQMGDFEIMAMEMGYPGLPFALKFETSTLTGTQLKTLSKLSLYYTLFEVAGDLLKPITIEDFHSYPESMVQILKYTGKTNEQFTRLLVNLAESACQTNTKKKTLLDPMCGKGTTLYEGFIRGLNVRGTDMNQKYIDEIKHFVVKFLKEGRYKHKLTKIRQTDSQGRKPANGFSIIAAPDKTSFNMKHYDEINVLALDSRKCSEYIKKKSVDMIVSDLPYGVQHGSKKHQGHMERSPFSAVSESLEGWTRVLKTNGSIVLAFNEYTLKYEDLSTLLTQKGLKVYTEEPYNNLLHRVDQAINRNVIVAIKE